MSQIVQPIHLRYLDGVRGLAALYVVAFHLLTTQELTYRLPLALHALTVWLRYGHFAVDVFIVLSGYCLMMPVARSANGRLPGGVARFAYRRARRILPPLWAALAFTLTLILAARAANGRVRADDGTAFDPANLLAHVFLVHNWFPRFSGSINLPMWTVAVEWQIYFVFALLLVPARRRFGTAPAVAIAMAAGFAPQLLMPSSYDLSWTRPWYLGLFALGMGAATVHFRPPGSEVMGPAARVPWGWVAATLSATVVGVEVAGGIDRAMSNLWAKDVLVGATTACVLICLTDNVTRPVPRRNGIGGIVVGLLASWPAYMLGAFSYSLYLTHMPLMWVVKFVVQALGLSPYAELAFRLTVAPACILPAAFAFYLVFERPFVANNAPTLTWGRRPAPADIGLRGTSAATMNPTV